MRCIVVSDRKRGHENQSLSLSKLLSSEEPLRLLIRKFSPAVDAILRVAMRIFFPLILNEKIGRFILGIYFPEDSLKAIETNATSANELAEPWTIISAGVTTVYPAHILARLKGAKHIHINAPQLFPIEKLTALIVPEHDIRAGVLKPRKNVFSIPVALSLTDEEQEAEAMATLSARLAKTPAELKKGNYICLLVGGRSQRFDISSESLERVTEIVANFARSHRAKLLVTTSRRTPEQVEAALARIFKSQSEILETMILGRRDEFNPIPAFLALAEIVVITEDSVSMISEAILSGHRPIVLRVEKTRQSRKFEEFEKLLVEKNLAVYTDEKGLAEKLSSALTTKTRSDPKAMLRRLGIEELARSVARLATGEERLDDGSDLHAHSALSTQSKKLKTGSYLRLTRIRIYAHIVFPFICLLVGRFNWWMAGSGALFVLLGALLRLYSSGFILKDEELMDKGPYGVCRNPLYLGTILAQTGFGLLSGSIILAIIGALFFLWLYHLVILEEEKWLAEKFGEKYQKFKERVPRLIPTLKSLNRLHEYSYFRLERLRENREIKSTVLLVVALITFLIKYGFKLWEFPIRIF